jgi:hypothetical protein
MAATFRLGLISITISSQEQNGNIHHDQLSQQYNFKLNSNAEASAIKRKEHLVILFAVRNHLLPRAV